jgi:ACR3 family arsenite transporter
MDTPERGILRNTEKIKDEEAGLDDGTAAKEQQKHASHEKSDDASGQDECKKEHEPNHARCLSPKTNPTPPAPPPPPFKGLSILDRFLVLWILLAMAIGIILANLVPSTGPTLQKGTFVGVSAPIAVGLLVMMYPILCKVRFETLHLLFRSRELWKQIGISFVLNWILMPLFMTALAWAFLPDRQGLRDGLIFVGVARCIAMVLIWTDLAGGDADYCAVLVAFNSILQIVLFAPMAVFYVQVVSRKSGATIQGDIYEKSATSVAVFLGIPLAAAVVTRLALRAWIGEYRYQHYFIRYIAPFSLIGLLYTIIVLFGSQGLHVVEQITSVLRVCAPLVVYFLVVFTGTAWGMWRMGFNYKISCTQSFTAASNNFELAIAVVVAVYGAGSQEALAATVGPLIEVPVLVALVYVIKWCKKRWAWE